jgi:hypothetical protein
MIRGATAFVFTVGMLAPAGWRMLDADGTTDGRVACPDVKSVEVDGALVSVAADRSWVWDGDAVTLRLQASAMERRSVTVVVAVEEDTDMSGGRVPTPPLTLRNDEITLDAAPGGGQVTVISLPLRGGRGSSIGDHVDQLGNYAVFVQAPAEAKRLQRRLRATWFSGDDMDEPAWYQRLGSDGRAARVDVVTRARDTQRFAVGITVPEHVVAGKPFTAVLTVSNLGDHWATSLDTDLDAPPWYLERNAPRLRVAQGDHQWIEVRPHGTNTRRFRVVAAPGSDHIDLYGSAWLDSRVRSATTFLRVNVEPAPAKPVLTSALRR